MVEFDLCALATATTMHGRRDAATRLVDFKVERLERPSFDRCDAAPQLFANCELDVFIEVHMDDLHGTRPRLALEQMSKQTSHRKSVFKIWTVNEVGTR